MANLGLDPADNKGGNVDKDKYFILKNRINAEIGERDLDGSVKEFFDNDDVGVIQSSSALQPFHSSEFKRPSTQPNTEWINKLKAGTEQFSAGRGGKTKHTVNWSVTGDNAVDEVNAVSAILSDWDTGGFPRGKKFGEFFWPKVKDWLKVAANKFGSTINNPDAAKTALETIKSDPKETYLSKAAGIDTSFSNLDAANLQDSINLIIGSTPEMREDILYNKQFYDFNAFYNEIRRVFNTTNDTLGPIFSSSIFGEFKSLTSQPHVISGVMANYQAIRSQAITGLSDTPSGYVSGQYLQATASGIQFADISQGSITFTGLADTSTGYESGKYLRSTDSGIEFADISQDFIGLSDTPTGYENGKFLISSEAGVGYTGVNFLINVEDRPSSELISGFLRLDASRNLVWDAGTTSGDITYSISGATHITGLVDTPSSYDVNKFLQSTVDGFVYADIKDEYIKFTELDPTPSSLITNKFLRVGLTNNLELTGIDFTDLENTPNGYETGKYLRITEASGFEYVDIGDELSFLEDIKDRPSSELISGFLRLDKNRNLVWDAGTTAGDITYSISGATHITGLADTPAGYEEGKFLKSTSNGFKYASIELSDTSFSGLKDTPSSYNSGQFLISNTGNIEFSDVEFLTNVSDRPSSELISGFLRLDASRNLVWSAGTTSGDITYSISGATHITGLVDTPTGYEEGKFLKSTSNGFEYASISEAVGSTALTGLSDTPTGYEEGKFLKSTTNGFEYASVSGAVGSTALTGLLDTPTGYESGKFLKSTTSGLEWADAGGGSGSITFTGLSDTPESYLGVGGQYLRVAAGESAIEFVPLSAGGGGSMVYPDDSNPSLVGQSIISSTGDNTFKKLVQGPNISFVPGVDGLQIGATFPKTVGTLLSLSDTPAAYSSSRFLKTNPGATKVEFVDIDLSMPVGSGFAKHGQVSSKDSFASEMPEHIYLRSADGNHIQTFAFTEYLKHAVNGYIEYAPTRSGVFGSHIKFEDDAAGTFKSSDAASLGAHNEISLSGYISESRVHNEAARNTGVYNQGLRAVLHAGSAELEEDLSIEPELLNVIGSYNNWTQLSFANSSINECKWTIPPSLTKNYLDGEVDLDVSWISDEINGNVLWNIKLEAYTPGDDIDTATGSSFRQVVSSAPSKANGLVNSTITFEPELSELKPSAMLVVTIKRDPNAGGDTMLGSANVLFASIMENI